MRWCPVEQRGHVRATNVSAKRKTGSGCGQYRKWVTAFAFWKFCRFLPLLSFSTSYVITTCFWNELLLLCTSSWEIRSSGCCLHSCGNNLTDRHTRDLCPFLWLDSLCFKRLSGHHNRDVLSIAGFDVKEDLLYYDKCRCDSGQAPPALVSLLLLHQSSLLF